MQRIRVSSLHSGQKFDEPLFSATGQKLLNAGVRLNDRHIVAIQRCGNMEVFAAASLDELHEAGALEQEDVSHLKAGQKAPKRLVSHNGQVLVEAGEEIEEHHIQALAAGGKTFSSNHAQEEADQVRAQRRERVLLADARVEEIEKSLGKINLRVEPESHRDWIKPQDLATWPDPKTLRAQRDQAVATISKLYAHIEAGSEVQLREFEPVVDQLLDCLSGHPTRFTQLALLVPGREDYMPDHAYTVTVLAMAIAAQLQWPVTHVKNLGMAGMLFDVGMLLVPERIRTGACELTEMDRSRVQRHPVFSLALLEHVTGCDDVMHLAALQHHERENGCGYPKGTRASRTHDYARVLAVADTYAAITEPRHYRQPRLPYLAMEETLRAASSQQFYKPAVRALIQAAGLFPVGSFVKLSNGNNAQIYASNPTQLDRPAIQPLDAAGNPKGPVIDMATIAPANLTVVRPIAGP